MAPDFSRITTWIFDLDNTLYSPHSDLFPQMHARMETFIRQHFDISAEEAAERRDFYFHKYGTSLRGLMVEENINPVEFLDFCHAVDLSSVTHDAELERLLAALPGRRLIFTNADTAHARRILERRQIAHLFDGIFDIADGNYVSKPHKSVYDAILHKYSTEAENACMFDDMQANLLEAANLGMTTVWLRHEAAWLRKPPGQAADYPHCHHVADDLIPFLRTIIDTKG